MRRRISCEKPVARIWLIQKVRACSKVCCHTVTGRDAFSALAEASGKLSSAAKRLRVSAGSAAIQRASRGSLSTSGEEFGCVLGFRGGG